MVERIKRYGTRGFGLFVTLRFLKFFGVELDIKDIYSYTLELSSPQVVQLPYIYKRLLIQDFENQRYFNSQWFLPSKIESLKKAMSIKGNIPYGIMDDKLILAYGWLSLEKMGFDENLLPVNEGYLWDDYTHPEYRGKGLHQLITEIRLHKLREFGKCNAVSRIDIYNRASRIGYKRLGFVLCRREIKFNIFNIIKWESVYNVKKRSYCCRR